MNISITNNSMERIQNNYDVIIVFLNGRKTM
jgi:hypothetical protein